MGRCKVRPARAREVEAVEEKEGKDDNYAAEDTPPESLVHERLDVLFAVDKILHCRAQRVECPNVESCQSGAKRENNEEHERSGIIRANSERSDGVNDAKHKMRNGEPADEDHGFPKRRFDDAVAHTYYEQKEERERVAGSVQNSHYHR